MPIKNGKREAAALECGCQVEDGLELHSGHSVKSKCGKWFIWLREEIGQVIQIAAQSMNLDLPPAAALLGDAPAVLSFSITQSRWK